MCRKSIVVLALVGLVLVVWPLASMGAAVSAGAARRPAGTPIGDTPVAPFRLYLPLVIRVSEGQILPADLTITAVYASMRGFNGGCVSGYEALLFKVCVRNLGAGVAGPFDVAVDRAFGARSAGLVPGESECIETTHPAYGLKPVIVLVDSGNEVAETNEGNNTWTGITPLPTPPPLCTPAPTPPPTASAFP